jgi:hypothetical protein
LVQLEHEKVSREIHLLMWAIVIADIVSFLFKIPKKIF